MLSSRPVWVRGHGSGTVIDGHIGPPVTVTVHDYNSAGTKTVEYAVPKDPWRPVSSSPETLFPEEGRPARPRRDPRFPVPKTLSGHPTMVGVGSQWSDSGVREWCLGGTYQGPKLRRTL